MSTSEQRTQEPRTSQLARIDMEIRFGRFVKDVLPLFIQKGLTKEEHDLNKDAFAYDYVPALAERLKLFVTFEASNAKGRSRSTDARIGQNTIRGWKGTLIKALVLYVQIHETLDTVKRALERVLRYSSTGREGVYNQLSVHVATLIDKYSLQAHVKARGAYGAAELQLILNAAFVRLPTGRKVEPLFQIWPNGRFGGSARYIGEGVCTRLAAPPFIKMSFKQPKIGEDGRLRIPCAACGNFYVNITEHYKKKHRDRVATRAGGTG